MSEKEFREVDMIELHDSGVCIFPENNTAEGWREYSEYEGTQFMVSGETICHIAQIFGMDPEFVKMKNTKTGNMDRYNPENMEFNILTKKRLEVGEREDSFQYGAMVKIKKLMAKVEGPHLLNIKIDRYYEGEEQESGVYEYTEEVTYSGNYTVWWKSDATTEPTK